MSPQHSFNFGSDLLFLLMSNLLCWGNQRLVRLHLDGCVPIRSLTNKLLAAVAGDVQATRASSRRPDAAAGVAVVGDPSVL